jgi:hypothetical protein
MEDLHLKLGPSYLSSHFVTNKLRKQSRGAAVLRLRRNCWRTECGERALELERVDGLECSSLLVEALDSIAQVASQDKAMGLGPQEQIN